ncbi:hypothetical protein [Paenarthrobacter ureafaciens]|uniref:hypothetical protein n=1 Tax=Paenarthrobacter ureafaciens TaxID=37931 RepID=UPI0009AE1C54|nr:hypothetical protein [Paenarthrobacter ureafaciens]GLU61587.1 hypothetical protein Pure01_41000 [Paenarthrobacter ureafaciens]GLU65834.1 hypothetical protein Pure02_40840 [Paenarthrobacter ureafaciens]GLU70174.1 hypothetical protein Pure03_41500 [Paenarthrobacter ureafaciens]GLU74390.1 hypothetical protein Pure04_41050 [Paenarthrobacter ureafaciens]GLU78629.1 hypothetical protein Pure05_40690 [Paenarthrobacter ureafaciens]
MRLTVKIRKATDGRLDLQVVEMPELEVAVRKFKEIPSAVIEAAASLTGRSQDDFEVEVGY